MIRDGERQPSHDDVGESITRNIYSGPKAIGAEKHAPLIVSKLLEKTMAGILFPLDQKLPTLLPTNTLDLLGNQLKAPVAGEQHKRSSITLMEETLDPLRQCFTIFCRCWIGHRFNHVNIHLLPVIERATDLKGLNLLSPNTLPKIAQIGIASTKSRTG